MATWKAENSMLTQRGVEILNKLKSGNGSITITKVVAGSMRVAESTLFLQTSISGEQKEMSITSKKVFEKGCEISVTLTNTDFIKSYNLHQIGVYVTHPDYSGEQLYHISQCDEDDFDTIPTALETPVTQGYTLYFEHGNSEAVTIVVDPQGMVSQKDLEEFAENFSGGGGGSARNLLHNWYLRAPIDTRKLSYVPIGISYFKEAEIMNRVGTTTFPSQVGTYVGNAASFYMNGVTYYISKNSTRSGYVGSVQGTTCIDRWYLKSSATADNAVTYLLKDSGGAKITLGKNGGAFYQKVDNVTAVGMFTERKYTFTVKVVSITEGTPILYIKQGSAITEAPITGLGFTSVTTELANGATEFVVGIKNTHTTIACDLQITMLKLEVGEKSTLTDDEPPADRAEQMAICIQFDPETDTYRGFNSLVTANILAQADITE